MRVALIVTAYFLAAILIGAALAPLISLATSFPLDKTLSRSVLAAAVVLFFPLKRALGIKSFAQLGFPRTSHRTFTPLLRGFLFGVFMLVPIAVCFLLIEHRYWEPLDELTPVHILSAGLSALLSGILVALIEETLFRGLIFNQLRASNGFLFAAVISSLMYSAVHFLEPIPIHSSTLHWYSGFVLAQQTLASPTLFYDAFVTLLLGGVFLCLVQELKQNLWWCIGLHAGWVTLIKTYKSLTDRSPIAADPLLVSNHDHFTGNLVSVWIVICIILLITRYSAESVYFTRFQPNR